MEKMERKEGVVRKVDTMTLMENNLKKKKKAGIIVMKKMTFWSRRDNFVHECISFNVSIAHVL